MKSSAIKVASSSVAATSSGKVYQFHLPYSSTPSSQRGFTPSNSGVNTNTNGSSTKMPAKMGWLRHVLTILSVVIFVSCLCTTLLHITQLSGAYKKTISCQQKTPSSINVGLVFLVVYVPHFLTLFNLLESKKIVSCQQKITSS